MKSIYVADDERDILDVVNLFLTNAGYQVTGFDNGDKLLAAFLQQQADLVILDVMMPGSDGFAICTELRKISEVPIVILSAKGSELDRVKGLSMGSDDYLVKPFSPVELVARVHSIFRRIAYTRGENTSQLQYGNLQVDLQTRSVHINGFVIRVTPTEYDFLVYLINRPEKSISREELLHEVWHSDGSVGMRMTDDLVKRIRKKLDDANSSVRIETIWGFGFQLTNE